MRTVMRPPFALLVLLAAACASTTNIPTEHPVYFSIELRKDGQLVGRPKLLGQTGKLLRAERRQPGAAVADYQLAISPTFDGDHYEVVLDVAVRNTVGHTELDLLHGQVQTVELGDKPGKLQVSLMVMRVDSPEFRTLMDLSDPMRDASHI